ncbi:MAG TPA: hypothetical protein ENK72_01535 [Epsilonproteobacteria bacterium]|nr:hypothetical protein [Campylobacterota bacterium]
MKDPDFFFEKEWYSFDACLERLMQELEIHYKETGSIQASIKKYAGEGEAADTFAQRVTSRAVSVMQEIDNVSLSKS